MLHWLHRQLVANPVTRRYQRRLLRGVKRAIRVPDAYDDIFRICRKVEPVAALDIGSHVGETVMNLAEEFPSLPIHAFEPTPATFESLRQRTAKLANVTVHQAAVGDAEGTMSFFVNREGQTNSLLEND